MSPRKRTDIHRPSAIIAAAYSLRCYYACATGEQPSDNVDTAVKLMRDAAEAGRKIFGGCGNCGVCGAHFTYGALYAHDSGDLVHFGHECAQKYEILADWAGAFDGIKAERAAATAKRRNATKRAEFLDANPGLETALAIDHHISADLAAKLKQYCALSPAQVALAFKLQTQVAEQAARKAREALEPKVAIVTGRREITGTILATKWQSSDYGDTLKMLVKSDAGEKLWSTVPSLLRDAQGELRGARVRFTATVEVGADPCFGFCKRPTGGERLDVAAPLATAGGAA